MPGPLRFNRDLSVASTPGTGLQYDKSKLAADPNSANFRKLSDAMARVEKEARRNEEEKAEREAAERAAKEARARRIATLNNLMADPEKQVSMAFRWSDIFVGTRRGKRRDRSAE